MLLLLGSGILLVGIYYYAIYYMDDSLLERYMNIGEELEEGTMANRTIIWSYIIRPDRSAPVYRTNGHRTGLSADRCVDQESGTKQCTLVWYR